MSKSLIEAIDLALDGQWDRSHGIVQQIEAIDSYWIHAVLHKIEGDLGNSRYWYSRAGKTQHVGMDPTQELEMIRRSLQK